MDPLSNSNVAMKKKRGRRRNAQSQKVVDASTYVTCSIAIDLKAKKG